MMVVDERKSFKERVWRWLDEISTGKVLVEVLNNNSGVRSL
jgi:hypothetical protein